MTSTILVTGGTGTLGRRVVPLLRETGHAVRVLSRHGAPSRATSAGATSAGATSAGATDTDPDRLVEYVTGDLAENVGLDAAVTGVDTIVHLGGSAKGDEVKTGHLVRAASRAGSSPRLLYISVVGADRVPVRSAVDRAMFGYYTAKVESERLVAASGLPWTTLRATQFYDSLFDLFQGMARSPVMPVFREVRFQPVDTGEVAGRLAELVEAPAAGLVPDLAGPRAYGMDELARSYLRAVGRRRLVLSLPVTGGAARAVKAGAILAPESPAGQRTWEDFLAARTASRPTRV